MLTAAADFKLAADWIFFYRLCSINQESLISIYFLANTSELASSFLDWRSVLGISPSWFLYTYSNFFFFPFQIGIVNDIFFPRRWQQQLRLQPIWHLPHLERQTYSVSVWRMCLTIDLAGCSLSCSVITGLLQASWQAQQSGVLCWE